YNPMKVAETLNSMKDKLLVVRGNCDAEVDEMISEFKFNDHILMEINGKKLLLHTRTQIQHRKHSL
ncbi:phosphodiesterase family, partial [human gut metagenome]